jgi:hypothetical protein
MAINKVFVLLGAGTAALVLVGVQLGSAPAPTQPAPAPVVAPPGSKHSPEFAAKLAACEAFADPDDNALDWDRAIQTCGEVLYTDPTNLPARKAKKMAEKEVVQKKLYEEGHRLLGTGEELAGMTVFTKLETESIYFRPARAEFIRGAPIASLKAAKACLAAHQRGDDKEAWRQCRVYGDVSCYLGYSDEDKVKPTFDLLKAANKGTDDWVCPELYKRLLGSVCSLGDLEQDRKKAIAKLYTAPALDAAVVAFSADYAKGLVAVSQALSKDGKDPAARKLQAQMAAAADAHQKGYALLLKNDLVGAGKHYQAALALDAQVMPRDWPSNPAKAMRYEISDKYAERSKLAFEHGKFVDSFADCSAGYVFSTSNPAVLECLAVLEKKAIQLSQGGCDDLRRVLPMTRPQGLLHRHAEEQLAERCKR